MISIQAIRDDPDAIKAAIARKGEGPEVIDRLLANDGRRRELLAAADAAKHERNAGSNEVGELVRAGKTDEAEAARRRSARSGTGSRPWTRSSHSWRRSSRRISSSSPILRATRSPTAPAPRTTRSFAPGASRCLPGIGRRIGTSARA